MYQVIEKIHIKDRVSQLTGLVLESEVIEEVVFQGGLAECQGYISLKENPEVDF